MKQAMRQSRRGVSLLEVLVASMILMVAVGTLTTQALVGVRAAKSTQLQSMATVLCRSILEEQTMSNRPVSTSSGVPGHPGWMASTRLESLTDPWSTLGRRESGRLFRLSVTVWQSGRNELISKVTLSKFVRSQATKSADASAGAEGGKR